NGVSSAFVVSDKLQLIGIFTLEQALKVRAGEMDFQDAIYRNVLTTSLDTQISDLIPIAAQAMFPIAVVEGDNQLKGIVTKAAVLGSLV
ncbi:MAG: gbuA, partial [Herbinix sp.]|nr:gbuA [Herbinix sp.]